MACNDADCVNPRRVLPLSVEQKEIVTRMELAKGIVTEPLRHKAEVMVIVVSGACRFHLRNGNVTIAPNQWLRIPAGTEHRAEALTDAIALNVSFAADDENSRGAFFRLWQAEREPAIDPQPDPDQYRWGV